MNKKLIGATGLLTVGLLAGGIASAATAANAANETAGAVSTSTATDPANPGTTNPPTFGDGDHAGRGPHAHADGDFNPGGVDPVRDDEKAVEADVAAKLTDLALAEVPGATVIRVETDGDGAAFEAHLKKADGTLVTVKFDANYAVLEVQDGMGAGPKGPGPKGAGHVDGKGHGRHGAPGQGPKPSTDTTPDTTDSTN